MYVCVHSITSMFPKFISVQPVNPSVTEREIQTKEVKRQAKYSRLQKEVHVGCFFLPDLVLMIETSYLLSYEMMKD